MARELETGRATPMAIIGDDALHSLLKQIANKLGAYPIFDAPPTSESDMLQFRTEPIVITNLGASTGLSIYLQAIADAITPSTGITGEGVSGRVVLWSGAQTVLSDAELTYNSATDTLSTTELDIGYIDFDLSPTDQIQEGRLMWNSDEGTLDICMPGGNVRLQIGQEILRRVYNDTDADMHNGDLVYISGSTGEKLKVTLAQANAGATWYPRTLYMLTEDIDKNHYGYVTFWGDVRDVNTDGITPGTVLYLSATNPGEYTDVAPTAPDLRVKIGGVLKEGAANGIVTMSQNVGTRLQDIAEVYLVGTPTNGDVLRYDSVNQYWSPTSSSSSVFAIKTDSYPIVAGDGVIICNKATAMTVTLPAATGTGDTYTIKNINTGLVTVDANGAETIDGQATQDVAQWNALKIIDYGAGTWAII